MRDFGMIPVLPGFSGQVPDGFVAMHPGSNFSRQIWNNFGSTYSGVYLLHPEDPLFQDIGTLFIREQTKVGSKIFIMAIIHRYTRNSISMPQFHGMYIGQ